MIETAEFRSVKLLKAQLLFTFSLPADAVRILDLMFCVFHYFLTKNPLLSAYPLALSPLINALSPLSLSPCLPSRNPLAQV